MSLAARRLVRCHRHLCSCGRHAIFKTRSNRQVRARADHDLCPGCWRRLKDAARWHDKGQSPTKSIHSASSRELRTAPVWARRKSL